MVAVSLKTFSDQVKKFHPNAENRLLQEILLHQLYAFEMDLRLHEIIETKVLIQKAFSLEAEVFSMY